MRVVICGGGVIGACAAYFLSRRGIDVTVVERTEVAQQHPVRLAASWLSTGASEPHSMRWRDEAFYFTPSCPTWLWANGVTAA